MSAMQVRVDDRARLMSALLAVSSWPEDEQARKPHGVHAHARQTRRYLELHRKHPAVVVLQALLERNAPLEAIYTFVMQLTWPGLITYEPPPWIPPTWPRHLGNFFRQVNLEQWWIDESHTWDEAIHATESAIGEAEIKRFLQLFVGAFEEELFFMPNVCYPTDTEIGVRVNGQLWCIAPPRIAWGDSPPWPFDEDPAHIYRAVLTQFGRLLMRRYLNQHADALAEVTDKSLPVSGTFVEKNPTWEDQFLALFTTGLVALYLERNISQQEANAYVLMQTKAQGEKILPSVVSVLQRFLGGQEDGTYANFADYLPHFGKHLRVAKTIFK